MRTQHTVHSAISTALTSSGRAYTYPRITEKKARNQRQLQ